MIRAINRFVWKNKNNIANNILSFIMSTTPAVKKEKVRGGNKDRPSRQRHQEKRAARKAETEEKKQFPQEPPALENPAAGDSDSLTESPAE